MLFCRSASREFLGVSFEEKGFEQRLDDLLVGFVELFDLLELAEQLAVREAGFGRLALAALDEVIGGNAERVGKVPAISPSSAGREDTSRG